MAAEIRILIYQQATRSIVYEWEEEDPSSLSLDERKERIEESLEHWKECSSFWPERLLIDAPEPMEVFLCLDGVSLAEGYNLPFLRDVVQQARRAMWGASVYVVVDKNWQPDMQDPEGPEPFGWIPTVLENKVSDILKWQTNFTKAAEQSRIRMRELGTHLPRRAWKCMFQTPLSLGREEEALFSPHQVNSFDELQNENCFIVLQEKRDGYDEYIREKLQQAQASGFDVKIAVIDSFGLPPELEKLKNEGHSVIHFYGMLELYYFLQRLNNGTVSGAHESDVKPVRVVVNPTFKSHLPQILITHSYLPNEKHNCLAAASYTCEITKDVDNEARVKIYPAIKCAKLGHILDEMGPVLAWIHIGHGKGEEGLQQADDQLFKSAQDWLDSFAGYKSSLALALFCSCRSDVVAERFAESGAGVAIGYAQNVNTEDCLEMMKKVVEATLKSNGSRLAILEAFMVGRLRQRPGDPNASPVAFWATH
jgi:hypothetical protein